MAVHTPCRDYLLATSLPSLLLSLIEDITTNPNANSDIQLNITNIKPLSSLLIPSLDKSNDAIGFKQENREVLISYLTHAKSSYAVHCCLEVLYYLSSQQSSSLRQVLLLKSENSLRIWTALLLLWGCDNRFTIMVISLFMRCGVEVLNPTSSGYNQDAEAVAVNLIEQVPWIWLRQTQQLYFLQNLLNSENVNTNNSAIPSSQRRSSKSGNAAPDGCMTCDLSTNIYTSVDMFTSLTAKSMAAEIIRCIVLDTNACFLDIYPESRLSPSKVNPIINQFQDHGSKILLSNDIRGILIERIQKNALKQDFEAEELDGFMVYPISARHAKV
jgi:hypothetical protein